MLIFMSNSDLERELTSYKPSVFELVSGRILHSRVILESFVNDAVCGKVTFSF